MGHGQHLDNHQGRKPTRYTLYSLHGQLYSNIGNFPRYRISPYSVECTWSRSISEVKQLQAWLVIGWLIAWEYLVLYPFDFTGCFYFTLHQSDTRDCPHHQSENNLSLSLSLCNVFSLSCLKFLGKQKIVIRNERPEIRKRNDFKIKISTACHQA